MNSKGAAYETLVPRNSTSGHSQEALKKELEQELQADKSEIGSYGWYHGPVPRNVAENLVNTEGEFLVRESTSTGEYVITCKWHSALYHFKVNTLVVKDLSGSKAKYSLEDDLFESLPALVTYHVTSKTPISRKSGAIITKSIDRNIPLSYADKKYASLRRQPKRTTSSNNNDVTKPSTSLSSSPSSSLSSLDDHNKQGLLRTPSPMHNNTYASPRSNAPRSPRTPDNSTSPVVTSPDQIMTSSPFNAGNYSAQQTNTQSDNNSMRQKTNAFPLTIPEFSQDVRNKKMASISPVASIKVGNANNNNSSVQVQSSVLENKTIPPKPSRVPSFKSHARKARSNQSSPSRTQSSNSRNTSPVKPIRHRYKTKKNVNNEIKRASCFKPLQYKCTMLPDLNGPLHKEALKTVKETLLKTDPFKLARHITVMDCKVCRVADFALEQVLLPSGKQLRTDIMERYQCIAFWVVASLLNGETSNEDRIDLLNVFVQTANELVHSLGNVFGFAAVMHGLTSPQVLSMDNCWHSLQIKYTNNSVTFQKKLRPLLKYMDEGKGQINIDSTCIPHLLPLLRLLENPHKAINHISSGNDVISQSRAASFGSLLDSSASSNNDSTSIGSFGKDNDKKNEWWENIPNESFDAVMSHLKSGRLLILHSDRYSRNCNVKLQDFREIAQLREICSTDFQLRLLFGYRGAEGAKKERYERFDKILTALLWKLSPTN